MSKKILIDTFFNQFTDFLKQLENMYPDDTDFPVFITTLNLLKSTNPILVVKFVKENIVDLYKDKILNKDESFFLDQDYTQHGDVDLNIVHKLKKYVKDMSPNSKDVVWKYIDLLMKLCLKILQF
jgi:hypothetical protein|uniref:Uncharacterized protein n=1 Tax=viral metagenome TaxID=1070528 RepID=A0A6C0LED8_9ZZZZ